jgi:hypothetical protein
LLALAKVHSNGRKLQYKRKLCPSSCHYSHLLGNDGFHQSLDLLPLPFHGCEYFSSYMYVHRNYLHDVVKVDFKVYYKIQMSDTRKLTIHTATLWLILPVSPAHWL